MVTYDWKDYRSSGKHKQMTMHAKDLLHLFSLHILPPAFVRIRHYGVLSPSNREKLQKVQKQACGIPVPKMRKKKSYMQVYAEKGWDIGQCPNCKCPMIIIETVAPARAPPITPSGSTMAHL